MSELEKRISELETRIDNIEINLGMQQLQFAANDPRNPNNWNFGGKKKTNKPSSNSKMGGEKNVKAKKTRKVNT
jgi:hypothetical protein